MLFTKILALISAFRSGDWAAVFRILGELFAAQKAGQITDSDFVEAERAMAAAAPTCPPKP